MKNRVTKRIFGTLLALVMLIGLIPASALPVFAATEITEIKTKMSVDTIPKAGMEVSHFMPNVPDGEPYERPWNGTDWYDSNGVKIAPRLNHHYDLGYEFEAGRTYYADYQYTADAGYVFAQNPTITFTGPDPSMFSYEIVDRWENNRSVTVRYTFTIPGEFDYPDINKVSMMYYGTAAENYKLPEACEMIYNNCTITREEWNAGSWGSKVNCGVYTEDDSNAPTFLAGERYVHMIELTANDGYKFSASLHVQKGRQVYEEEGVVTLSDDRTVATVKFTYDIGAYIFIDTVELVAATQHVAFMLHTGESIYLPQPFGAKYALADDCPYAPDGGSNYTWVVDETGEHLHLGYPHSFELGKSYTLKFAVRIKDEYRTTHKFATNPNLVVSDYVYARSDNVQFKISGGGQIVNIEVTFTAQFPKGAGETVGNPVICTNYAELKFALQHPDIRYIRVDNFQNSNALNYYILTEGEDYIKGNSAITIPSNAVKNLEINTDINLRATQINGLMYSFIYNRGSLYVSGTGSLNVSFNAAGYISAIILNDGYLQTTGVTLDGTNYSFDRQHGYAIVNYNGDTVINGGTYIGYKSAAVSYDRGSLTIYGGTFRVKEGASDDFALNAAGHLSADDHHVTLYGGTFDGIRASQVLGTNTPKLRHMLPYYGYLVYEEDGVKLNVGEKLETDQTVTVKLYHLVDCVDLTITVPVEGANPDYWVRDSSEYYNADYSSHDDSDFVKWYMSSDGDEWWEINESHKFMAGYYYKIVVDVISQKGAMFLITDSFQPDVTAKVNGYAATVKKTYDQDPQNSITVTYNFGECNDSVVEKITIVDLKKPEAGERPTYTANILGTGYQMNTAMNAYKDIYWTNPTEKWYYIKNGIGWWDVTEEDWVYEHEQFIPGHEYRAYVYLITEDGYEFAYTAKPYENAVTATMNGNTAEVEIWDGYWAGQRRVKYTFTCEKKDVSTVILSGLEAPKGGELPDHDIVAAYPEFYTVAYVYWYDEEGYLLYGDDTFRAGETYKVEIKIVPTQIGGVNAAQFVSPVKAYLNGAEVTERLDWDAVYTSSGNVYVYYTFTEPAAGSATNATVSGLVTTGGNEADDVTIQLIPQGSDEAEYGIVQSGNSVEYFFFAVKAGTYTLKVMKNGHETYETELVVGSANIIHDVTLTEIAPAYIPGDVDGNGKVNNRDLGLLQLYLNDSDLTDKTFNETTADLDGNGKLNNRDLGLLQKLLNN